MSPTTPPLSRSTRRSTFGRGVLPGSMVGPFSRHRLRVTPWQSQPFVALVGPGRAARTVTIREIRACIGDLADRGVLAAVTPALSPIEAEPFFQAGFELHEHLHLLARPINGPPPPAAHKLRAGRPWHRAGVLDVDNKAFEQFWQFDAFSLREARRATPASRFRVCTDNGMVTGYAVTGRAGGRGYLQRLAVDPTAQGRGIGASLVNDAVGWLHRRGAGLVLVNTQERNSRALGLYERLGFIRQREGLLVLRWERPA